MTKLSLKRTPVGRGLISLTALATMVGPYVFDWNETHIRNPKWPPHAKFHNAQTMSMGAALSLATLYHLWKPGRSRASLDSATITASLYWFTQLSAGLYPGTASVDPPGEDDWPQLKFALPILGTILVGYLTERRRITRN
ncbi:MULTISPECIES: DUF6640 family protein [unclassified Amycolatopsis]|uniref:DUF6640 family protein n=1 Tax=unclassified Amycolatopsis TaxID=2618356 RepID=UPI002E1EE836|nr:MULTISPECIES: DUF6640 family protein [unclassified Amycolatopsis]